MRKHKISSVVGHREQRCWWDRIGARAVVKGSFTQEYSESLSSSHKSVLYVCASIPALQIGSNQYNFSRSHMYAFIYGIFLFLTYFTLHDRLQVPPNEYKWPNFFPFYGWVIFHCISVPYLLYSFTCWWTYRLFACPGYCKQSAMNTEVHVSFLIMVFSGCLPSSCIAGSYGSSIFCLLRNL